METTEEKEFEIVYAYTDISGIRILRRRDGDWWYHYTPIKLYRYAKGNKEKHRIDTTDWLGLGEWVGVKVERLLKRCKKVWNNSPN